MVKKNNDYGDSFYKSLDKNGIKALTIRLEDKFNRLDYLTMGNKAMVKDEGINDTILDIAGYCMLYLTYVEEKKQ